MSIPQPAAPSRSAPRRIAVYCASAPGHNPAHRAEADALGRLIAQSGWGLVYGGANVGMMGAVADAALSSGGEVIGVLPRFMTQREIAHLGLTQLLLVDSMHERKARMLELADAVIALPGGFGTLDELMEALTWVQIGIHAKPCLLVNTLGYYDGFLAFLETAVQSGFLLARNRDSLLTASSAAQAIHTLNQHWSASPAQA
jgi:uncharacterized protein (TIGR00730 family)